MNVIFFSKSSKLNFDLCQRVEIFQVGLNMHLARYLYDNIRDASSPLRGLTSSLKSVLDLITDTFIHVCRLMAGSGFKTQYNFLEEKPSDQYRQNENFDNMVSSE